MSIEEERSSFWDIAYRIRTSKVLAWLLRMGPLRTSFGYCSGTGFALSNSLAQNVWYGVVSEEGVSTSGSRWRSIRSESGQLSSASS